MPRFAPPRRPLVLGALIALLLLCSGAGVSAGAPAPSPAGRSAPHRAAGTSPFVLPVDRPAVVLTPFRPPANRYGAGHRGVDLAAAVGSAVRAAGAGTVVFAGALAGRGVISIDHPVGLRTTYEPVSASVRTGDAVVAGQVIGALEAGHASCAPRVCLHWGARLPDGSYLDPMGLLTQLHVRLLPWDG